MPVADPNEEPRIFADGQPFRQYPYVIRSLIGRGGSGQVYLAQHKFTDDLVALKVCHIQERQHATQVQRSLIQAQAAYRIRHQHIVRVLDIACEEDGMVWQLMERLVGQTVAELLDRYGRFSPLYALEIAIQAAWGLQAAHEQQVIHRDVQPSNVFVTEAGQVKVLDFSLAKVIPAGLQTTMRKRRMGTAGYMAPESLRAGTVPSPRLDVYGLGTMVWQMLAGRHPFEDCVDNMALMVAKQISEEPASLVEAAGLPAYCEEVVRGAIAKDPARRYAGMWDVANAFSELKARLAADPAMAARLRSAPAWERRHPLRRDPESRSEHAPPHSLPRESPPPAEPSARVVVPGGVAVRPPVAATVPMVAVSAPPSAAPAPPVSLPPTERLRERAQQQQKTRRWPVAVAIAAPVLAALGVGVWLLADGGAPGPTAPSASGRRPAASAPAAPHRAPAPAPRR